jgi:hypothetical protein
VSTKPADDADLLPRLLDGARQQRGVSLKLLAGRCQSRSRIVPNKQLGLERFLQTLDFACSQSIISPPDAAERALLSNPLAEARPGIAAGEARERHM